MIKIAPSLLAIQPQTIDGIFETLPSIASADYLHIDVMDGKWNVEGSTVVPETVFHDPRVTAAIAQRTNTHLDVHLMVEHPGEHIGAFAEAGADIITFHYEAVEEHERLIASIQSYGIKVGVALNPDTPLTNIESLLGKVDMVLLMSVVPGKCGQAYIEEVTEKISELRVMLREGGYDKSIEVDGGVKVDNAYMPINAGADIIVSGSGVFSQEDPDAAIKKMKDAILIGSDHGGFELKGKIMKHLDDNGYAFVDVGTYSTQSCDYPDVANSVAEPISSGFYSRGILVCGTGQGMAMTANTHPGVRAALGWSTYDAEMTRSHNNANVMCFGERSMDHKLVLESMIKFLQTPFSGEERHQRRVEKIEL